MNNLKHLSLLYVEDEEETLNLYLRYFKLYFNEVYSAKDGEKAIELYYKNKPDVIIMDINIPYKSGIDVAREIRKNDKKTKIIMLTSMSDKQTFLNVIELHLTTFLEKPVSRKQLIQAFDKIIMSNKRIFYKKDNASYSWDYSAHILYFNDKEVKLTKNEIKLLQLFMRNINRNFSYQDIYEEIWFESSKMFSEAAIKTLIRGLRLKLPPKIIENVYGIGYRIFIE